MYPLTPQTPYSNAYLLNLDWLLDKVRRLETADPEEVASIIEQFRAEIEQAQQQVQQAVNATTGLPSGVANPRLVWVGPYGCDYATVKDAVNAVRGYASPNGRVVLVILPGVYQGSIDLINNPGIDMVAPAGCTIVGDQAYPHAALFTTGQGLFKGITFYSPVPGTYALHIEGSEAGANVPGDINFIDCTFNATYAEACGIGEGVNFSQYFTGCKFFSAQANGNVFYVHNMLQQPSGPVANINLMNCSGYGYFKIDDYSNTGHRTYISCTGCAFRGVHYQAGTFSDGTIIPTIQESYIPNSGNVILQVGSGSNAPHALNSGEGALIVMHAVNLGQDRVGYVPIPAGYQLHYTPGDGDPTPDISVQNPSSGGMLNVTVQTSELIGNVKFTASSGIVGNSYNVTMTIVSE